MGISAADIRLGLNNSDLSTDTALSKAYAASGRIVNIDSETMVCSVILDKGLGKFYNVRITAPGGAGPRSYSGVIPEVGSLVIVKYYQVSNRVYNPVIIEYMTPGIFLSRDYDKFISPTPEQADTALATDPMLELDEEITYRPRRLKFRKVYSGDFISSSSAGSDFILDEDVHFSNRAGLEVRLRDSDRTAVLTSVNESFSNAAGRYRRGLIRRSSYAYDPDILGTTTGDNGTGYIETNANAVQNADVNPWDVDDKDIYSIPVPKESPSFEHLRSLGLIDDKGYRTASYSNAIEFFPPTVDDSGTYTSYVTSTGNPRDGLESSGSIYVEDRKEIFHKSDGTLPLNDESDGFDSDIAVMGVSGNNVFIEDVHGTVVGNDIVTDEGKKLYKRLLKLEVLNSEMFSSYGDHDSLLTQRSPISPLPRPVFSPIDEVTEASQFDTTALARLYRIVSPTTQKEFIFAVSKEGKVFANIPKASSPSPQTGTSVDLNLDGLFRAVFGKDSVSGLSLDWQAEGGIRINSGTGPAGYSLIGNFLGDVDLSIGKNSSTNTQSLDISGSVLTKISGSNNTLVKGSTNQITNGTHTVNGESIILNAQIGGVKLTSIGPHSVTAFGHEHQFTGICTTTYSNGSTVKHVAGIDRSTSLAGSKIREVTAIPGGMTPIGPGIFDSVDSGFIEKTVKSGKMSFNVNSGTMEHTVTVGNLNMKASAGISALSGSASVNMSSDSLATISAPLISIGNSTIGFAVAGIPGVGKVALDYVTGLPLEGIPNVSIG